MKRELVDITKIGSLGIWSQISRFVLGFSIIVYSLHLSITDGLLMTWPILIGSVIALVGIIGWDPLSAFFRSMHSKLSHSSYHPSTKTGHPA